MPLMGFQALKRSDDFLLYSGLDSIALIMLMYGSNAKK